MMNWTHPTDARYRVTDDPAVVEFDFIERMLRTSYWAADRPRDVIERSWHSPASVPFALMDGDRMIGFARAVTDRETFAWICDVMIDPAYRAQGLGQFLMRCAIEHPAIRHVRMILGTQTAHTFYEKFGFERRELMRRPAPTGIDCASLKAPTSRSRNPIT
jgi:GNAT superfamily N-acetyltransferase